MGVCGSAFHCDFVFFTVLHVPNAFNCIARSTPQLTPEEIEAKQRSADLDAEAKAEDPNAVKKLLLLGAGESGFHFFHLIFPHVL